MHIAHGIGTASLLLLPALAGCVTLYSPPAVDEPHAELVFTSNLDDKPEPKDYSRHDNMYYAFADDGCAQPLGGLGKFVKMFSSGKDAYRVAAGKRIYIRAASTTLARSGQQETLRFCYNLVSFVPEERQVYEMHQEIWHERTGFGEDAACRVTLLNRDAGPVKSFAEHRFEGECARLIGR